MKLSTVLETYRKHEGLTLRTLGPQIGVDHTTLWRFLQGHPCDDKTLVSIWIWLLEEGE